ncbi:MAG: translation elongation factor-like protein [Deltaproteobacteria bacterium RIFCSPLOWO2_01_44_7]|nr:MAG: translation elongation factor-like protein [Deltaproteobacteria bacterium RIFCSPHIGHO2_01_FULL_43_49]OGQ14529.1 MAG: translation elongation factor-like protein [Deltaproteobacteria bacterium RIFCSPHIGHO2_02_FULL_44_53]OGQ27915.1 MAG: translation elongation factor-like protein [Deltaproteobacteria bacterium RIFCSPHIGHO2_12_FULL_44_21]OGQ31127.1 MAG: translation elongation factor-like protein [Deltaproteobacteria bacterium RIFCSPLOWO2_01_FULL_45_74]OGQ38221.1 MAG: translation elongation f
MPEEEVGFVTHYFGHIPAAAIKLSKPVKSGDKIHIKGHTTDFEWTITQMQVDHKDVTEAKKGASIGIKVAEKCREHDKVFKVTP